MAARRRQVIGATATVGAFLAVGAAPAAHADFDDLFQPFIDALSAVDPGIAADTDPGSALASLDSLFDGWYQNLVTTPINDLEQWLFGGAADASAAGSAVASGSAAAVPDTFTVPLTVNAGTEPVVNVSVGGGAQTPVLVDTGAAGLVMPIWDVNPFGITGLPTGFNFGQFGGSLDYFYVQLPTTVTFTDAAGDTVTADSSVDAVLFAFPADFNIFGPWSIGDYLGPANVVGVLGVGPNALGPTPDAIPTAALPGDLGQGLLIDQANNELIFGANPLTNGTSIDGAPWTTLDVSINGGTPQPVSAVVDSGGVYGTMPSSVLNGVTPEQNGGLPDGTTIAVYQPGTNHLLYEYTVHNSTTADNSPTVTSGTSMNTGNIPFAQQPIYISYSPSGQGTTIFGGTAPNTVEV
ncbi:PecA family PE domain-processing aspartic protease [[Mycobacterium] nativiensis]|uniref:PecA family PE domain-processing aspartic protease n=1 Tax=[Mycobacterium] nativiensis TaxID=2855503 RepID=A0ABU5XUI8_9MYCO|nr:PecA family PE domain-processing aspartic protease [Mycolicibacter sp. MYC340]MEB3031161.1 PecA family PE domain-processing aspartic protease [Mycolicibacter sp. MYC340]